LQTELMTSHFTATRIASRTPARATGRVCAPAVAMQLQAGVAAPPRSPGPGRP
jgi:hypothetical protein